MKGTIIDLNSQCCNAPIVEKINHWYCTECGKEAVPALHPGRCEASLAECGHPSIRCELPATSVKHGTHFLAFHLDNKTVNVTWWDEIKPPLKTDLRNPIPQDIDE